MGRSGTAGRTAGSSANALPRKAVVVPTDCRRETALQFNGLRCKAACRSWWLVLPWFLIGEQPVVWRDGAAIAAVFHRAN
jgi:hypothetical protein